MMLVIFLLPSGSRRSARVMPGSVARRPALLRDEQPEPSERLLHSANTLSLGRSSDPTRAAAASCYAGRSIAIQCISCLNGNSKSLAAQGFEWVFQKRIFYALEIFGVKRLKLRHIYAYELQMPKSSFCKVAPKERFNNNLRKLINGIPPFSQSSNEFPQVVF
ncbi:MAG: hypothetical protein ABTS16_20085 [Candidatus Accumulibacter phosphatis]|jgi:hypothetical protein|nr:hypothetical protein [Accumulibacter sp.]